MEIKKFRKANSEKKSEQANERTSWHFLDTTLYNLRVADT